MYAAVTFTQSGEWLERVDLVGNYLAGRQEIGNDPSIDLQVAFVFT